jgi:hypothetical protein
MFGNKQKTQGTTDPAYGGLQDMLLKMFQQKLSHPSSLPSGYEAGGISNINKTYDLIGQRSANDLTSRGLGTSPVAGVVEGNNQQARGSEITKFQQQIPLLNQQMQMQDMLHAMGLLGMGKGTQTTQGGGLGGGLQSMGQILAYLYGGGQH